MLPSRAFPAPQRLQRSPRAALAGSLWGSGPHRRTLPASTVDNGDNGDKWAATTILCGSMPVCSTLQDGTQIRPEAVEGGIKPGQVTVPFQKGRGEPASTADNTRLVYPASTILCLKTGSPGFGFNIRSVLIDGLPWFIASDVCAAIGLGVHNAAMRYKKLDACDRSYINRVDVGMKPGRPATVVTEAGLYRLIMRSDKPEAREFQDWVTREVLPSIRKTGTYALADHGRDQMPGEMRSPTWRRKRTYPAR